MFNGIKMKAKFIESNTQQQSINQDFDSQHTGGPTNIQRALNL